MLCHLPFAFCLQPFFYYFPYQCMDLCCRQRSIYGPYSAGISLCNSKVPFADPPVKGNIFKLDPVCLVRAPVSRQPGLSIKIEKDSKDRLQTTGCKPVDSHDE